MTELLNLLNLPSGCIHHGSSDLSPLPNRPEGKLLQSLLCPITDNGTWALSFKCKKAARVEFPIIIINNNNDTSEGLYLAYTPIAIVVCL